MTADQIEIIQKVIYLEGKSFLKYLQQAQPIIPRKYREFWQRLEVCAKEESLIFEELIKQAYLQKISLPKLGDFPLSYTNYHFVEIKSLIPLIIEDHNQGLSYLNTIVHSLPTKWKTRVEKLIQKKQETLQQVFQLPVLQVAQPS